MDLSAEKNIDHNKMLLSDLQQLFTAIKQGGGKKRLEKIKAAGKMTARERVTELIDPETTFEIGGFAGHNMYKEAGGCPAGGVICGLGKITGRLCVCCQ